MIDALHPALAHHLVNSLGWRDPRPLQGEATEPLLAGRDALLLAPTAGGKTEAAMFPCCLAGAGGHHVPLARVAVARRAQTR